jgi:hypothetical protein
MRNMDGTYMSTQRTEKEQVELNEQGCKGKMYSKDAKVRCSNKLVSLYSAK